MCLLLMIIATTVVNLRISLIYGNFSFFKARIISLLIFYSLQKDVSKRADLDVLTRHDFIENNKMDEIGLQFLREFVKDVK